jgi:hypothetical protein
MNFGVAKSNCAELWAATQHLRGTEQEMQRRKKLVRERQARLRVWAQQMHEKRLAICFVSSAIAWDQFCTRRMGITMMTLSRAGRLDNRDATSFWKESRQRDDRPETRHKKQ